VHDADADAFAHFDSRLKYLRISMKKKNDEFLASPIYHARSLPQTHRTKVQILIVRFFFSALSFASVVVVRSIVAAHSFYLYYLSCL
jgi:hypothetical protein